MYNSIMRQLGSNSHFHSCLLLEFVARAYLKRKSVFPYKANYTHVHFYVTTRTIHPEVNMFSLVVIGLK